MLKYTVTICKILHRLSEKSLRHSGGTPRPTQCLDDPDAKSGWMLCICLEASRWRNINEYEIQVALIAFRTRSNLSHSHSSVASRIPAACASLTRQAIWTYMDYILGNHCRIPAYSCQFGPASPSSFYLFRSGITACVQQVAACAAGTVVVGRGHAVHTDTSADSMASTGRQLRIQMVKLPCLWLRRTYHVHAMFQLCVRVHLYWHHSNCFL